MPTIRNYDHQLPLIKYIDHIKSNHFDYLWALYMGT